MKKLKYSWNMTFPGIWRTREGHYLTTIDNRTAKQGYGWYRFKGREFMAKGSFQAQSKAEKIIEEDLQNFKKALNNVK